MDADGVLHLPHSQARATAPMDSIRGRSACTEGNNHMEPRFEEMPRTTGRRRVNLVRCAGLVAVVAAVLSTAFKAMPA